MGNDSFELKALTKRFKELLSGDTLSEEEKNSLAEAILKIVYSSKEEE